MGYAKIMRGLSLVMIVTLLLTTAVLAEGRKVSITLKDGTKIEGTLIGYENWVYRIKVGTEIKEIAEKEVKEINFEPPSARGVDEGREIAIARCCTDLISGIFATLDAADNYYMKGLECARSQSPQTFAQKVMAIRFMNTARRDYQRAKNDLEDLKLPEGNVPLQEIKKRVRRSIEDSLASVQITAQILRVMLRKELPEGERIKRANEAAKKKIVAGDTLVEVCNRILELIDTYEYPFVLNQRVKVKRLRDKINKMFWPHIFAVGQKWSPTPRLKIEKLIKQLGADDRQTRDAAQKELTKQGEGLIEEYCKLKTVASELSPLATHYLLLKAFAEALREATQDKDVEMIRMRTDRIRQHLYSRTLPKIAFVSGLFGDAEIYVIDADGGNQKRLTENQECDDGSPTWSPDGTKIAFAVSKPKREGINKIYGNYKIYVMDADGKNQQRLTENKVRDYSPTWSPDGTKIAFESERDGNKDIYVMDADGKNPKRLTENKAQDVSPTWSPDGTKIAFGSGRDGNYEIYVMDADGKNQQRLTVNKAWDGSPAWSPDGKKIAFESKRDGNTDIYVMDADGGNQKRLTKDPRDDTDPAWSPDGTKIAFASQPEVVFIPNLVSNTGIYVMDADGRNRKNLTKSQGLDGSPAWSPLSLAEISGLFAENK